MELLSCRVGAHSIQNGHVSEIYLNGPYWLSFYDPTHFPSIVNRPSSQRPLVVWIQVNGGARIYTLGDKKCMTDKIYMCYVYISGGVRHSFEDNTLQYIGPFELIA